MRNSKELRSFILVVGLFATYSMSVSAQQKFASNIAFCAVDMSVVEAADLIERIQEFHKKANRNISPNFVFETLTIQDNLNKLELKRDFTVKALEQGPEVATRLSYRMSRSNDSPISDINFTLGDHQRKLQISGTERDLVKGLLLLVEDELKKIGCSFGGSKTRSLFGIILFVFAFVLAWVPFILIQFTRFLDNASTLQVLVVSISSGISIGLNVIVFALPWTEWLPGAAIRTDAISTWDQFGPYVSVVGVLVGLAGLVMSIVSYFRPGKRRSVD